MDSKNGHKFFLFQNSCHCNLTLQSPPSKGRIYFSTFDLGIKQRRHEQQKLNKYLHIRVFLWKQAYLASHVKWQIT